MGGRGSCEEKVGGAWEEDLVGKGPRRDGRELDKGLDIAEGGDAYRKMDSTKTTSRDTYKWLESGYRQ